MSCAVGFPVFTSLFFWTRCFMVADILQARTEFEMTFTPV